MPWFERNLKFGYPKEMLPFFLERLEGTIIRLEQKVKSVNDKTLSTKLDGKWSIKENIGHLAEVDEVANKRLDEIVNGVAVMSPAVFEPRDYSTWSIGEVLQLFTKNRTSNIEKYRAIQEKDLLKSSLHPRLKVAMTPVDLAWFDAEHDDHHLVKINEILAQLSSR